MRMRLRSRAHGKTVSYTAIILDELEPAREFYQCIAPIARLPAAVERGGLAQNLSTLSTTTCFRTADWEFHAWEADDDQAMCFWTTARMCELGRTVFVSVISRSLQAGAFGLFDG